MKNRIIALILCFFTGIFGGHHYYLGNVGKGIFYTLTAGGFIIGWIYDTFNILLDKNYIDNYNNKLKDKKDFREELKVTYENNKIEKQEEKNQITQTIKEKRDNGVVCCPKCGSSQLSANKKGFSLGKALVGGVVLVPIAGVVTGMIGKNKIIITCLNCGKQFKPGR